MFSLRVLNSFSNFSFLDFSFSTIASGAFWTNFELESFFSRVIRKFSISITFFSILVLSFSRSMLDPIGMYILSPPESAATECSGRSILFPMPANAPCEQCGRKSLKLQAQENFVDKIARQGSILGGLGLWGLKRGGAIEKVFALENVDWVLDMSCERCGKRHRRINEFRILCITCDHCGGEIALPVQEVPKL